MKTTFLGALLVAAALSGCMGSDDTVESTISFHFGGRHADITDTVVSDLSDRPTKAAYKAANITHPAFYSLHDQLEDWSRASGIEYSAEGFSSAFGSGFFLTTVAGVTAGGSDAYWALEVNDIAVSKGMTDIKLNDGDVVAWIYTPVNDGA